MGQGQGNAYGLGERDRHGLGQGQGNAYGLGERDGHGLGREGSLGGRRRGPRNDGRLCDCGQCSYCLGSSHWFVSSFDINKNGKFWKYEISIFYLS